MSLADAIAVMQAWGYTSDASPMGNFGPLEQVRAQFRKADACAGRVDVVAYFVDSIGLTCVVVDARTGPQVTLEGIRLVGRKPSELAHEISAHLEELGKAIEITPEGELSSPEWGMVPRAQRAGDVLLTRAVFGRPNSWANTMFDCIPADEWVGHRVVGSFG
ncbi:hypothetical protein ACIRNI_16965 [Streptomyces sp. NPDC093546]|uniref:hypothetical protein n=1 Tax=Streptomyces sp. NPDC093546 TaxID=3366040 RepID=UPI0037F3F3F5